MTDESLQIAVRLVEKREKLNKGLRDAQELNQFYAPDILGLVSDATFKACIRMIVADIESQLAVIQEEFTAL